MSEQLKTSEVKVGDKLLSKDGTELTVTRIDPTFLTFDGMMAFVEDSDQQWFKMPAKIDSEVTVLSRG
ncbi:MAG: hypothetical protein J2O48_10705 [Solirubrobacterales bacterium]|nr:hypothetical protein [Solirubrobacterales bacterium]